MRKLPDQPTPGPIALPMVYVTEQVVRNLAAETWRMWDA
jgi:hypothetical protein